MNSTAQHIAVIGGGLAGLTAALDIAKQGMHVDLYESAPSLGGRTQSFFHHPSQSWVDHGPHLLIGAYHHTIALLKEIDALQNTQWQNSLNLPLWDMQRGHFSLATSKLLPFPLALMHAVYKMPHHGMKTLPSLLRMALSMKNISSDKVSDWMIKANIHPNLQRDMLEVLCLAAMNEHMHAANAASFAQVLQQAFSTHHTARLGWFTKPLSQALIQPLESHCKTRGVHIHTSSRVLALHAHQHGCDVKTRLGKKHYHQVILACSPSIRNKLLHIEQPIATQSITNIHLWFDQQVTLQTPFVGGIGTYGQWFFDISQQFNTKASSSHICAVISADKSKSSKTKKVHTVLQELQHITQQPQLQPISQRIITVQTATHCVCPIARPNMPKHTIDACEQPTEGELPATIETAVLRGHRAAQQCLTNTN